MGSSQRLHGATRGRPGQRQAAGMCVQQASRGTDHCTAVHAQLPFTSRLTDSSSPNPPARELHTQGVPPP